MSAVMKERDSQAFYDSQQLPPDKRGVTFEALFYRQLEQGIEAAYADAEQTMACNMMDAAALEGVQAFIDKRKPAWAG